MKLIAYKYNGEEQWGVLIKEDTRVLGARDLEEAYFAYLPESIDELLQNDAALFEVMSVLERYKEDPLIEGISLSSIQWLAPLHPKKNIFCVGKNYAEHAREFDSTHFEDLPAKPIFFTKSPTAIIGNDDTIDSHQDLTNMVDYEGELAVIIGKRASKVTEADAMNYVFGYTILNDVTARDLQSAHNQWFLSKSLDTFCPMGPVILVKDEYTDESFRISTLVNGEERQYASTEDLIFSIPTLISTLSQGITLEPGDIIATGTPYGVGMGQEPPQFLRPGDTVEISISSIGTLRNHVK